MDSDQDNYLKFGPYLELMAGIRTALDINQGIIKVVGKQGTGKTALCQQLVRELKAEGFEVIFFESPPESSDYLYQRIRSELGLDAGKNFDRMLHSHLLAKSPPNNKLILIYDDAEKISRDIFILIRLLNNIHGQSDTLVSQVICGTARLDRIFDDPELRSLTQYLNQSFYLEPMTREALEDFHAGYCREHGITSGLLKNKDLTDIYIEGQGLPGKTMALFDRHYGSVERASLQPAPIPAKPTEAFAANPPPAVPAPGQPAAADEEPAAPLQEISSILDSDEKVPMPSSAGLFFKVVVSGLVVVVAMVLSYVLSGNHDMVANRLNEILADDSPLYMDEVQPAAAETTVPAPAGGAGESGGPPATDAVATGVNPEAAPGAVAGTAAVVDGDGSGEDGVAENTAVAKAGAEVAGQDAVLPAAAGPGPGEAPADRDEDAVRGTVADGEAMAPAGDAGEPPAPVTAAGADTEEPGEIPAAAAEEPVAEREVPVVATIDALDAAIRAWADAWAAGDFAGYLDAYHDDFMADTSGAREEWESQRRSRIDNVAGIHTDFDRLEITSRDQDEVTARFWLYYSRGNYADETHKELVFRRAGDHWLITAERNLEVITR